MNSRYSRLVAPKAERMYLFTRVPEPYTPCAPYTASLRSNLKKEIYKSVKDLVKSYEREFKKGKISKFTATVKVKAILTTGIKLVDYNTSLVENELKKLKSIKDKEKYLFDLKFG